MNKSMKTAIDLPPQLPRDLISIYDMMFMFDRGYLMIWKWRREKSLPFYVVPGSTKTQAIRYSLRQVKAWAAKNGREIIRMPTYSNGLLTWPDGNAEFEAFVRNTRL